MLKSCGARGVGVGRSERRVGKDPLAQRVAEGMRANDLFADGVGIENLFA
jgi:hypothetical protein